MAIRQPIITVCGHVDHGKTSILDCLRSSSIQEGEAGGITQKISFTSYPLDQLKSACPLIEKSGIELQLPGFLLIDTPGHAAFTNLRKRGGSLADLAVLVIDINEGIKPQTAEVLQILKHNKTPFIIALNKIDNISGWRSDAKKDIRLNIESQPPQVKQIFDERYLTFIGSLQAYGLDADLFYNVTDYTKKIALIPTSARTREGVQELIMMVCGLSQKYLTGKITLNEEPKGVVLEVKKEKGMNYTEAILYDGTLKKSDEIAVASLNGEPIITKIRILEEIKPLSAKFEPKDKVTAATGLRMQLVDKSPIMSGMPFERFSGNLEDVREKFKKEIETTIQTEKQGIIAKADSLGSLEALLVLLKEQNIPVVKASIGQINKTDIISAKANLDINELDAVIVGFNVQADEEVEAMKGNIKIVTNEVVYKLIDDVTAWRKQKAQDMEKARLMKLATIGKAKILHEYCFRNTNPAIFGVRMEGGKIRSGLPLITEDGEKVGRFKSVQKDNKPVDEIKEGDEAAVSLPGVNFERALKEKTHMYTDLSESQFKAFRKNKDLLSQAEIKILQEIAQIKQQKKEDWGAQ